MLSGIKMKKAIAELNSDHLKIYVYPSKNDINPGIKVHSETTAPMVLKFHMQHEKVAGLQNDEFSLAPRL